MLAITPFIIPTYGSYVLKSVNKAIVAVKSDSQDIILAETQEWVKPIVASGEH
jgi:hypothetical protein